MLEADSWACSRPRLFPLSLMPRDCLLLASPGWAPASRPFPSPSLSLTEKMKCPAVAPAYSQEPGFRFVQGSALRGPLHLLPS